MGCCINTSERACSYRSISSCVCRCVSMMESILLTRKRKATRWSREDIQLPLHLYCDPPSKQDRFREIAAFPLVCSASSASLGDISQYNSSRHIQQNGSQHVSTPRVLIPELELTMELVEMRSLSSNHRRRSLSYVSTLWPSNMQRSIERGRGAHDVTLLLLSNTGSNL